MTRRTRLHATASVVVAALLAGATPAAAVIGGTPDGVGHPYVGAIDGRPVGGPVRFGSGVLISPTVLLTVGHGTARFEAAGLHTARVTFDSVVTDTSTFYEGTIHTNPGYDPTGSGNRGDFGDLGVIVFDRPIPDVSPARLPSRGELDDLAGRDRLRFEIPGYGISSYTDDRGERRPDADSGGTRTVADATFSSLSPGFVRLHTTDGDICIGDSGSPNLLAGADLVLGITAVEQSLNGAECESSPWAQRVDTPGAQAFLGQYVELPE